MEPTTSTGASASVFSSSSWVPERRKGLLEVPRVRSGSGHNPYLCRIGLEVDIVVTGTDGQPHPDLHLLRGCTYLVDLAVLSAMSSLQGSEDGARSLWWSVVRSKGSLPS
jgi:hypothetical protein